MNIPFLDERQNKDVEFCRSYAEHYRHGADGHNRMITVALLASAIIAENTTISAEPLVFHSMSPDEIGAMESAMNRVGEGSTDSIDMVIGKLFDLVNTIDRVIPDSVRAAVIGGDV